MKADNIPEKIYVSDSELNNAEHCVIWFKSQQNKNDIEYTHTDTFIEKACDAYCKVCGHYAHTTPNHICRQACDYFMKFKNYIKRE